MLHRNIAERGGFRPLTDEEIEAVSGGFDGNQIIVTGRRLGAPGFGGGGLGGGGLGGGEGGPSENPILDPDGGGGGSSSGIQLPIDIDFDLEEEIVTVSADVSDMIEVQVEFDLNYFSIEEASVSFTNNGVTFTGLIDFSELEFGVDTTIDFGDGITGEAMLQLQNDGSFENFNVIFKAQF